MAILITDWQSFDQVLPIATRYAVGLEIQEFATPKNLENPDSLVKAISDGIENIGLVSMHGPFSDLVPASRDPLVRQVAEKRFRQAMDIARATHAQHLILHSGYIPKTYPGEMWLDNTHAFWMNFLQENSAAGLIHLENVYEDDFDSLRALVDRVNESSAQEKLTVCLDIGHVNANSSRSFEDWIGGLGDRIRYVHLHNNGGRLDDHWRLDKGTIVVEKVLDLLVKNSPHAAWCVETPVTDVEPSLMWLKERGYL